MAGKTGFILLILMLCCPLICCGESDIHRLVSEGNIEEVKVLLEKDPRAVMALDSERRTPLHTAAQKGYRNMADLLLEKGADLEVADRQGCTPLLTALRRGNTAIAILFIERDARVNIQLSGETPLIDAVELNSPELVSLLLDKGADLNDPRGGRKPLHHAARQGYIKPAEILLSRGAPINARDNEGRTALHEAAAADNRAMVELLCTWKADINIQDCNGSTPLDMALCAAKNRGTSPVPAFLKIHGGKENVSPAQIAAISAGAAKGDIPKVKALIAKKTALVNSRDERGLTPLCHAIEGNHLALARFLISRGAAVNRAGYSPLHCAAATGNREIITVLLSKNADVNAKTDRNVTPLHVAASAGHKETAGTLIVYGARVNARTTSGETPLHFCIARKGVNDRGQRDTIRVLAARGADLKARDNEGKTPLRLAMEKGNIKAEALLRTLGAKE